MTTDEIIKMHNEKNDNDILGSMISEDKEVAYWKGSTQTARMVAEQIKERWGDEEVKKYDPTKNCFTLLRWNMEGYKVKKGEKGLKSVTFMTVIRKNKEGKDEEASIPRNVTLFYYLQVEPKKEETI